MRRTFLALALTAALLAGCGGDDEEPAATATAAATEEPAGGGGGGETIDVSAPADGSLKFDQSELSAKAGKVTIKFANPSQVPHAVEIEGNGVETETETVADGDASVSTDLKPGTYTFYCPVGQHREAGMEGTLTVK
jgi:plastocyanin